MLLEQIISKETKILELYHNQMLTWNTAKSLFDVSDIKYQEMFYHLENQDYVFKNEINSSFIGYPYTMMNEIVGSYLANEIGLPTVQYSIAKLGDSYGLASLNFRKSNYQYSKFKDLPIDGLKCNRSTLENIRLLEQSYSIFPKLLEDIFSLFALDYYMLQKDRVNYNLQFQTNNHYKELQMAPLYDYSNCIPVPETSLNFLLELKNPVMDLNFFMIQSLLKNYPVFQKKLKQFETLNFKIIWNRIKKDYQWNTNSNIYGEMQEYYFEKDRKQKQNIKNIL